MAPVFNSPSGCYSVHSSFTTNAEVVVSKGDCLDLIQALPDNSVKLIVTSPPYNLNKEYEENTSFEDYIGSMVPIINELKRVLDPEGSICWQVGNYVRKFEIFPLDIFYYTIFKESGFKLRNRIIWHYEHGLHATRRFSGRYETLLWFTKGDKYTFNLDKVRIPAKYPGKRSIRGKKAGQPSGNPLGKNPTDFWKIVQDDWDKEIWDIPNVKANHLEKTVHPCQFPIELVERCVLAFTYDDDWVLDPFAGVGSSLIAALKQNRRAIGFEKEEKYIDIALQRIKNYYNGNLRHRVLGTPIYTPKSGEKVAQIPPEWITKGQSNDT